MNFYQNPILGGDFPDPSVLRVGDDYYLTHSSFSYAPGLLIWHSRDLIHWQPRSHALPWFDGDVWAPDLIHHEGTFFIYYKSSPGNRVVWARQIDGPWSAPVALDAPGIDPGHVVAPDGKRYLHVSDGLIVPLSDDGLKVTGPARKVFEPWPIPNDWAIEGICLEGPKFTFRNGWYYLNVAQGGTAGPATSHMVISARSRFPWGPWEYSPHNPIIHTSSRAERWWSRGHGTLVDTASGSWWMMYHAYENGFYSLGRQTLLEPVEWTADDWFRVPPGSDPDRLLPLPIDSGEAAPLSLNDDFSGPELAWPWRFLGEHNRQRYRFENNALVLRGSGATLQETAPLACIPMHRSYEASIDIELPDDDTEAGFLLFYNHDCRTGLGLRAGGVRQILRTWTQELSEPGVGRRSTIRIHNRDQEAWFYLLDGEGRQIGRPTVVDVSGFHHNVFGGFVSLRLALYAVGAGEVRFRNFRYRELAPCT